MESTVILRKAFTALVPLDDISNALSQLCGENVEDIAEAAEFQKRVEAARKYDSKTRERTVYWGKVAIESERQVGRLIAEGQEAGTIHSRGGPTPENSTTVVELFGSGSNNLASRSKRLAEVQPETVTEYIAQCEEEGETPSKRGLLRHAVGAHVGHNSGENEWYTPVEIIARARQVMGSIDLDPASSETANKVVEAEAFYSEADNGLERPWHGNVWLNPPYAMPLIEQFCQKLINETPAQAVTLTNNGTETKWGQLLLGNAAAVCFPSSRVKFWSPGKESATPLQGQMICYFGRRIAGFRKSFETVGVCW